MSTLTALARAEAWQSGFAEPIATVRHVHMHDRPYVFIPLTLAGEANAPLAALAGADRHAPEMLVVANPRSRDDRFAFAADLAASLLRYIESFASDVETAPIDRGRDIRVRYADAPQILTPNPGGVGFIKLFGRSTRFRRADGPYPVDPAVPPLGQWLTFLAERAGYPGSSLLVPMTAALAQHWATGQSAMEDQNLAALLGWIDPPAGRTGREAATLAEDPVQHPPAGPATDPTFDNEVLAPLIAGGRVEALARAVRGQLEPTWELVWRGVDRLRELPPGAHVAARWNADKDAYTDQLTHIRDGGVPQPRRDSAVAAAARLSRLERAQASYAAQRAFDDPLVFAEYRMSGEAFAGEVIALDATRVVGEGRGRKLRPLVTLRSDDFLRLPRGAELVAAGRPGQKGEVVEVDGDRVTLELSGGMGRTLTPPPETMPSVGERLRYTTFTDAYQPVGTFPDRDDTPWTHGGPPAAYEPNDEDAQEDWS